jgi:hypothetical protein
VTIIYFVDTRWLRWQTPVEKQFLVSVSKGLFVSIELKDIICVIKNRSFFMPAVMD